VSDLFRGVRTLRVRILGRRSDEGLGGGTPEIGAARSDRQFGLGSGRTGRASAGYSDNFIPTLSSDLLAEEEWSYADLDRIRADFLNNSLGRIWSEIRGAHKWLGYFRTYEEVFSVFRGRAPRVLEIGVDRGGSLRLWKTYFGEGSRVVGLDVVEACRRFEDEAAEIFVRIGSQSDPDVLRTVVADFGPFDLIIDDGSHRASDQVASFNALFGPGLRDRGIYFVEDLQCVHWGRRSGELDTPYDFLGFCADTVGSDAQALRRSRLYVLSN